MTYLFFFLILISCTDTKQSTKRISFDYIPKEISTEPNLAYTNSSDLFWLEGFLGDYGTVSKSTWDIYYQPISNRYYYATIHKTNGLKINYKIPDERMYIEYTKWTNRLRYVGSINFTNRTYIDNKSNQYIKRLSLIDDDFFVRAGEMSTEYPLKNPVFPFVRYFEGGGTNWGLRYYNEEYHFWRGRFESGKLVQTCGG